MAGDERDGRLDHAPHRRPRQRPGVPRRRASRSARDDTYGSLAARLQALGGELLLRGARRDAAGTRWSSSSRTRRASPTPRRSSRADRLLDPARPAAELERVVRALHPHIGARASCPTASCSACTRPRSRAPGDGPRTSRDAGRERARRAPAAASAPTARSSCSSCSRRAGGRWTPPPTCAVTACRAADRRSRTPAAAIAGRQARVGLRARAASARRAGSRRPRRAARSPPRRRAAARADLRRGLLDRQREHRGRLQLVLASAARTSAQRPGTMCSTIASSAAQLLARAARRTRASPSSITER